MFKFMKSNLQILSEEIIKFLSEFAILNPNFVDDFDNYYASPDAHSLSYCAELLCNDKIPTKCFSEWSSGGYKPYSSQVGRTTHNYLVETNNILNKNHYENT